MDMIGSETVVLRAGMVNYPMAFVFSPCSAVDVNDGSIPYGTTISTASVQVLSVTGKDITSIAGGGSASVVGGLRVDTTFDFPAGEENGKCKVFITLNMSDASVLVKRWDGLEIE